LTVSESVRMEHRMELNVHKEVAAMQRLGAKQLRTRYAEVFGETTVANNKVWLIRRIAWRLQALAEGDLSERARRRAEELANDADLRLSPPRPRRADTPPREAVPAVDLRRDGRLPPPGSVLARVYRGETLLVRVLADGFEFEGTVHASLSAVAKAITGSHCNGFLFFRIAGKGGDR
jgi:Protein of unknown function (DUF2924)